MKAFIDANIIVAVLNKEYPVFTHAARVLSLSANPRFHLYTSPLCYAIAWYFACKKSGAAVAKEKMKVLADKLKFAEVKQQHLIKAAGDKRILDFEDGMQYYSAMDAGCKVIITENKDDFHFSSIEVNTSEEFLANFYK